GLRYDFEYHVIEFAVPSIERSLEPAAVGEFDQLNSPLAGSGIFGNHHRHLKQTVGGSLARFEVSFAGRHLCAGRARHAEFNAFNVDHAEAARSVGTQPERHPSTRGHSQFPRVAYYADGHYTFLLARYREARSREVRYREDWILAGKLRRGVCFF